jgi:hypothetical protein
MTVNRMIQLNSLLPISQTESATQHSALSTQHSEFSRRDVLRMAAGLGMSFLLPALDGRAANERGPVRAKSLLLLWMGGGPSQLETWDPHPGKKIGGPTKSIKTKIEGLEIADLFPKTAEHLQHLNVIRSMVSKEGDHERGTYLLKTGYRPDPTLVHPSLGAIMAHEYEVAGETSLEIPRFISLVPGPWPGRGGFLGDQFDAFKVFDPRDTLHNMEARVGAQRQERRIKSLDVLENTFAQRRRIQTEATLHRDTVKRALTMMTSDQLKAFRDIDKEPQALRDAYGDSQFGRGCLVARRLLEVGVRAVEVELNGFDTHARNFSGHITQAEILDPAFATLINDLHEHDLLSSTVVLCIGEFGRTPNINPLDGRDHWPTGFSAVVGGGGFRSGLVIGATDPEGKKTEPEDPIEVADLFATILHTVGIEHSRELQTPIGRPMKLSAGKVLDRLLR